MRITPQFLHNTYEKIAKEVGWKTQESCREKKFKDLPSTNQLVMRRLAVEINKRVREKS